MTDYNRYLDPEALTTVEALIDILKTIPHLDKTMLDLSDDDDEQKVWAISSVINEISAQITSYIGRNLGMKEYNEVKANAPTSELTLANFPVKEVKSISFYTGGGFQGIDDSSLKLLTDLSDLKRGAIYLEPIFPARIRTVGITNMRSKNLKSIKVEYTAGYVLPKDETADLPSDLPRDIEGVVLKTCKKVFGQAADNVRTDGLIAIQEGNIKREWASNMTTLASQFGDLSVQDQSILRRYRVSVSVYSV